MFKARSVTISIFWVVLSVQFIHAQDLSGYREFQFGMNLPAIAKQAGLEPSAAKVIHKRPELIQELTSQSPFSFSSSPQADSVKTTLFSFYNGELSRIVISYDPHKTKGLTAEDMVEAISVKDGTAIKTAAETTISSSQVYNDNKVVIARWEDSQYSFTLFRSSYLPDFGMIALSKRLDALAQAANIEAARLDEQEAPQREIERKKKQDEENRAAQEGARSVNKPVFRP